MKRITKLQCRGRHNKVFTSSDVSENLTMSAPNDLLNIEQLKVKGTGATIEDTGLTIQLNICELSYYYYCDVNCEC